MVQQKINLHRSIEGIAALRSQYFMVNIADSFKSDLCQKAIHSFRERPITLHTAHLSYRTISHWDSLELINCERDIQKKGWRRFNLIERLWVEVIFALRKLGLSLDQIKLIKPFYFEEISEEAWLTYAEYYCLSAYLFERPTRFIILGDGQAEFLDYSESKKLDSLPTLGSYISLNINVLLSEILNSSLTVNYTSQPNLSDHQFEIYQLIDFEDFDFLKIIKEKNKLKSYEYQKSFSGNTSEKELTEGYENYEIKKKVVNGKNYFTNKNCQKKALIWN